MDIQRELECVRYGLNLDAMLLNNREGARHIAANVQAATEKLDLIIRHIEHERDAFANLADEIERRVRKVAEGVS